MTTQPLSPGPAKTRLHYLDASRAIMLLLGVPLHASEVYRVSGGYGIDSPENSVFAALISGLIHSFRMQAFFLISGFFAALVISSKGRSIWFKGRWSRLAIPLVAGSLLLGPLEQLVQTYLTTSPHFFDNWVVLHMSAASWIRHRWFLITLIVFCAVTWAAWGFSGNWLPAVGRLAPFIAPRTALHWLGLMAFLVVSSFAAIAAGKVAGDMLTHSTFIKQNVIDLVRYSPFFALGIIIYLSTTMERFTHPSRIEGAVAVVLLVAYLAMYFAFYSEDFAATYPHIEGFLKVGRLVIEPVTAYFVTRLFFSFLVSVFKTNNKVIDYLVDASLCIYLVHMLFVIAITGYLLDKPFNPTAELFATILGATCLSLLAYEGVKRSNLLSWALNGKEWRSRQQVLQAN